MPKGDRKKMSHATPLAILCCLAALPAFADGQGEAQLDVNALIKAKLAAKECRLVLPAGVIRSAKTIELMNLKDFTLEGAPEGTTIVCETGGRAGFNIRDNENVAIKKLKIDFNPLPFTQGTALSVGESSVKVKLHLGYPKLARLENLAMHVFDPATRLWKSGVNDFFGVKASPSEEDGVYLISCPGRAEGQIAPGDLLAFDWRGSEGIMIRTTQSLLFEDVDIFSSPSLGIGGRFITGQHVFRRVRIMRGPTPEGATEPRLLSTSADGLNYASCVKGPIVESCDFSFMGDDGVNFHGPIVPVVEVESPTSLLVVRPYQGERLPEIIAPGMTARFLKSGNFEIQRTARIASFSRIEKLFPPGTPGKYYPLFRNNLKAPCDVYRVTFEEPVENASDCYLDIPDINCPNFSIRDSRFHDHRARGLRLMASGGIVENCSFERISQNAITIGPEYGYWREAGWASSIAIRNNKIFDVARGAMMSSPSCYAPGAIASFARIDKNELGIKPGNSKLSIEGNIIDGCQVSGVFLNGVDGATVSGNTLRNVCRSPLGKDGVPRKPIDSVNSSNVKIESNIIE